MKRFTILIAVLTATGCRALPSGEFVDPVPTMDPLGAAGGFLVPTPGQRRRERMAKAEGEAEVSRRSPSLAAGAAPGEA